MKIIAELCQNHNGDPSIIESMVDSALEGGATHVKLQSIYADDLTFRPQFEEGLKANGCEYSIKRPWKPEYDRLKKLELDNNTFTDFVDMCTDKHVVPLTTCFSINRIPDVIAQGFKELKIASYDCASYQLIRDVADKFDHIYISTGATFDNEIIKTFSILKQSNIAHWTFLHCVTIYPTPLDSLHLSRIQWLKKYSEDVGFSDHTSPTKTDLIGSCAAIYLGANVIERHFTVLDPGKTKDGPVSVNKNQLSMISEFANFSRSEQENWLEEKLPNWSRLMIGSSERLLSHAEILNRDYYRGRFSSERQQSEVYPFIPRYNWEEV